MLRSTGGPLNIEHVNTVCRKCRIGDWFVLRQVLIAVATHCFLFLTDIFLSQLKRNIDPRTFTDFIATLAADFASPKIMFVETSTKYLLCNIA